MGRSAMPLPGDTFTIQGQWSTYNDRFHRQHRQVETKRMKRRAVLGDLLGPFLCRVPNIGRQRADRLVQHYGHDLFETLSDASRIGEVAGVLEPDRPALAARISAQLFAAVAEKGPADNPIPAQLTRRIGHDQPKRAVTISEIRMGRDRCGLYSHGCVADEAEYPGESFAPLPPPDPR
jgi:hypothetical protein